MEKIIIKRFESFHRAIANHKMDFLRPWKFIGQRNQYSLPSNNNNNNNNLLSLIQFSYFINKFKTYGNNCNRLFIFNLAQIQLVFTEHHTPNTTMQCNAIVHEMFCLWITIKSSHDSMQPTRRLRRNKVWITFDVLKWNKYEKFSIDLLKVDEEQKIFVIWFVESVHGYVAPDIPANCKIFMRYELS